MDKRLLNSKTVVTGGSRGIGAGIVQDYSMKEVI